MTAGLCDAVYRVTAYVLFILAWVYGPVVLLARSGIRFGLPFLYLEYTPPMIVYIPLAAFIEEALFRVPLALAYPNRTVGGLAVVLSAIAFGFAHGGAANILSQGVAGLGLSWVFLRCGGWRGNVVFAGFASMSAHAAQNFILLCLIRGVPLW